MSKMISIIVPIYNVKDLLEKCIESIKCQTYTNYEVLMIDDGSTDGSGEIADMIAQTNNKFYAFHKKNGGLSDARNYGLKIAKGDYYLFIDSDDVLHRDFCKTLIDAIKDNNADIASTDLVEFYSEKEVGVLNSKIYETELKIFRDEDILREYFYPRDRRVIYHGLCMKMYKKELFDGILFDVGKLHEDVFITYKLLDRCKCFVYIDAPYYYYYQKNANSISNNYGTKNFIDEYEALSNITKYFESRNNIKEQIVLFCSYHYISMLYRIRDKKNKEIKQNCKKIRKWVKNNVKSLKSIGKDKKIKLLFGVYFTKLYIMLRKRKNGFKQ